MNTKQLALVTFEQAKRLEALGFNWINKYAPIPWYDSKGLSQTDNFYPYSEEYFTVPSVALALKWMRDKKGFDYSIRKGRLYNEYGYLLLNGARGRFHIKGGYEAAENALLDELLTILGKEKEQ
jgi:hypothetical protein